MNFIFISPHFPHTYWNFCQRLKQNGVTVLVLPMHRMRVCHKEKSEMKKYTSSTRCWHQTGITSFKIEFVRQPQCCLI